MVCLTPSSIVAAGTTLDFNGHNVTLGTVILDGGTIAGAGDTLAAEGALVAFPAIDFPSPLMSFAIEAKNKGDEDKDVVRRCRIPR